MTSTKTLRLVPVRILPAGRVDDDQGGIYAERVLVCRTPDSMDTICIALKDGEDAPKPEEAFVLGIESEGPTFGGGIRVLRGARKAECEACHWSFQKEDACVSLGHPGENSCCKGWLPSSWTDCREPA